MGVRKAHALNRVDNFRRETKEKAKAAVSAEAKRNTHMAKTADKCKQPAKPVQVCAMTTGQAIKWLQTLPPRAKMAGTCGDQGLCMKYDCGTKTVSVAECLS